MKNKCEPKIIQKLTNQLKQLSETDITVPVNYVVYYMVNKKDFFHI